MIPIPEHLKTFFMRRPPAFEDAPLGQSWRATVTSASVV